MGAEDLPVAWDHDVGPLQCRHPAPPQGLCIEGVFVLQGQQGLSISPMDSTLPPPEEVSRHKPDLAIGLDEEGGVIRGVAGRREDLDIRSRDKFFVWYHLFPPIDVARIADLRLRKEPQVEDVVEVGVGYEYEVHVLVRKAPSGEA
ncbi:MAG: hypothetical protein XD72_1543 [Methanothrix harundinacea]|uniref:Uncharacterized protein n=1 Tax=Methanothrix harundinacea TaxID=301375 RepID=A0A101FTB6_9EURY|nr:MAG: hypothetical protein XD72_1543 [Methanothrix harundinacea]